MSPSRPLPSSPADRDAGGTTAGLRAGLLALGLALAAPATRAQEQSPDPRDVKDPREATDPRDDSDPRAVLDPRDPPPGMAGFDELLQRGSLGRLRQALVNDAWRVLPWVEGSFQRWLQRVEPGQELSPGRQDEAGRRQQEVLRVARLADEALVDTAFSSWIERALTWTEEERRTYQRAAELYQEGLLLGQAADEAQEAMRALTPLQQALQMASGLGHLPGEGRALSAIGLTLAVQGREQAAREAFHEAVRRARLVRDHDTTWEALEGLYRSWMRAGDYDQARVIALEQLDLANATRDSRRSQGSLHRYLTLGVLQQMEDETVIYRGPRPGVVPPR